MNNVNANNQKIADFKNNENPLLFLEPHKTIYIDKIEDKIDIEKFGEEYQKLKDENKIKNKEDYKISKYKFYINSKYIIKRKLDKNK